MISRFFPFFHQKTAGTGKRENREKKSGKTGNGKTGNGDDLDMYMYIV
jgi:hypothetical protein